jgi:hypothetical protein
MIIVREATLFLSKVITISHMASLYFLVDMGKPSISDFAHQFCRVSKKLIHVSMYARAVSCVSANIYLLTK